MFLPRHIPAGAFRCMARLVLATLVALISAHASAGRVVIVTSGEAQAYKVAESAALAALSRSGHEASVRMLDDVDPQRVSQTADAILAIGGRAATRLSRGLTSDATLIYCMVADPESRGLQSDAGRVTGVSTDIPVREQFERISEALPRARTIGMIYNPEAPRSIANRDAAHRALPKNWRLEAVALRPDEPISAAIDRLLKRRIDVIWTAPDSAVYDTLAIRALLLTSIRRGVPVFGFSAPFVRAGALLGTHVDPAAQGRSAADLAHRAVTQSGPAPPPETADYDLVLNLIVAGQLGVRIPERIIERADQVFRDKP